MAFARSTPLRSVALLLSLVHLGGCYAYQHVPLDAAPMGATVRGHLSESGAARARELTGRERRTLEGRLVRADERGFELALPVRTEPGRAGAEPLFESITLAHGDVVQLELRRLDRTRTGGLLAAAATAAAVLLVKAWSGDAGGGVAPPGGGGTEARGPR
jgi:hypothetical protein